MLNDEQLRSLRASLDSELKRLTDELAELGHGDVALEYDANFADTSQVTAERGEVDALSQNLLDAKNAIDTAIERMNNGTYGTCEVCGKEISFDRLEAMPDASLCIDDANKV